MRSTPPSDIDAYIASFPAEIGMLLQKLRQVLTNAAPGATEKISYHIPTLFLNGNLVHFAAFKNHLSFFPTSSGVRKFETELSRFKYSNGTIRFPIESPIPFDLVRKIVKFRVEENSRKVTARTKAQLILSKMRTRRSDVTHP